MPTYNFKNIDTDEEFEIVLRMSDLDQFKIDNPNFKQIVTHSGAIVRDSGRKKPDEGFRDVLRTIKKGSGRNNTVNTF